MSRESIILLSDGYKISHARQLRPGTEYVYSYFESRGGPWKDIPFFGLQYLLKEYIAGEVLNQDLIEEAADVSAEYFQNPNIFNHKGWEDMLHRYEGRLPLSIFAPPEGMCVPNHNIMMAVENTDKDFYWLTNYLETLLVQLWYPCTVATQSREMKKLILKYLHKTGTPSQVCFKLHDFGFRGVSSVETAKIGGAAHLLSFLGTDTLAGITMARRYYNKKMAGFSIPAAEHSTITSWGQDHEMEAMENMLKQYPTGLVAVVSDSFNIFEACSDIWGGSLRQQVLDRDGVLVIRPDSGDPIEVLVKGTPNVMTILGDKFGYRINNKGYKVLNDKVRVIQGDGIDFAMLDAILQAFEETGWSADNISFGSGGGLLQKLNRDTLKFAFKCAAVTRSGVEYPVFKNPITDKGKRSKSGRMKLVKLEGAHGSTFITVPANDPRPNELVEVFRDGKILVEYNFDDIRERAK